MLAFGGNIALDDLGVGFLGDAGNYAIGGLLAILIAAFIGAMVVMGIITFFSAIAQPYGTAHHRTDGGLSCQQRLSLCSISSARQRA